MAFSFVNIILYYTAFAYFDNILNALAGYSLPAGFLSFLRLFIVFALGFMIGLLIIISMKPRPRMNYFDLKTFLIVGFIPAIGLILSGTGAVNLMVTGIFDSNPVVSDLAYYFFSNNTIWALWLGVSIGSSVRLRFKLERKKFKHQVTS